MRRPRFLPWIRNELKHLSQQPSCSLRTLVRIACQRESDELSAALLLYAHEYGCLDKLYTLIGDNPLLEEYRQVERHLGQRSVERLALKQAPLQQLPLAYRKLLEAYRQAYYAPERLAEQKHLLQSRSATRAASLRLSPTEIARELSLEPGNVHAYLVRGDIHRFTLETAQQIDEYLQGHKAAIVQ